jgi:hypothetical protein
MAATLPKSPRGNQAHLLLNVAAQQPPTTKAKGGRRGHKKEILAGYIADGSHGYNNRMLLKDYLIFFLFNLFTVLKCTRRGEQGATTWRSSLVTAVCATNARYHLSLMLPHQSFKKYSLL